ncbi:hypothetical protein BGZ74_002050 [Mortierella antarctica]|nr:hypothetical protein BGZ74_002050 [Mortierella antarctica]
MLIDSIVGFVGFISMVVGWFNSDLDDINRGSMRFTYLVGRDGNDMSGAGAWYPRAFARSTSGTWVGKAARSGRLESNEQKHVDALLSRNEEIDYLKITYWSKDALCLAVVSWAPPSTTHNYKLRAGMVTGDIFRLCGYDWNHSGQGIATNDGGFTYVSCAWMAIDRGFTKSFDLNLGVMGNHFIGNFKNSNLCGLGIAFERGDERVPRDPMKRSLSSPSEHIAAFGNKLRVHKDLSAIELCDSPTSWGSSFLSLDEGILCDMSTKTKIPICKVGETGGCFVYEKPRVNGRNAYSTKRDVYVKGSTMKYNATYFVVSDANGKILDDGQGY